MATSAQKTFQVITAYKPVTAVQKANEAAQKAGIYTPPPTYKPNIQAVTTPTTKTAVTNYDAKGNYYPYGYVNFPTKNVGETGYLGMPVTTPTYEQFKPVTIGDVQRGNAYVGTKNVLKSTEWIDEKKYSSQQFSAGVDAGSSSGSGFGFIDGFLKQNPIALTAAAAILAFLVFKEIKK